VQDAGNIKEHLLLALFGFLNKDSTRAANGPRWVPSNSRTVKAKVLWRLRWHDSLRTYSGKRTSFDISNSFRGWKGMVSLTLRMIDVRRKSPVPSTGLSLRPFIGLNTVSDTKCLPASGRRTWFCAQTLWGLLTVIPYRYTYFVFSKT